MSLLPGRSRLFAEGGELSQRGYLSQLGNTFSGVPGAAGKVGDALYQYLPPLAVPFISIKRADLDAARADIASVGQEKAIELTEELGKDFAKITSKKMLPGHAAVLNDRFTGLLTDVQKDLSANPAYFANPSNRAKYVARYQQELGSADVQKAVAAKELVDKTAEHHLSRQDLLGQHITLAGQRSSMTKGDYFRKLQTDGSARTKALLGMRDDNPLGTLDLPTVEGNAGDANAWITQMAGLVKPSENGYSAEQIQGLDAQFGESEDGSGKKLKDIWYQSKIGNGSKTTSNAAGIQMLQHMARNITTSAPPTVLNALREQGAQAVDNMSVGKLLEFTTAPRDKNGKLTGPGTPIMLGGKPLPNNLGVNQARAELEDLLDTPGLPPEQRAEINRARSKLNQLAAQQADAEMTNNLAEKWNLGRINGTVTTHTEDVGRGQKEGKGDGAGDGSQADFEQRVQTGDSSVQWDNYSVMDADGKTVIKQALSTTAPPAITDEYSKTIIRPDGQHKTLAQYLGGGKNLRVLDANTLNILHSDDARNLSLGGTHLLEATGKLVLVPIAGQEHLMAEGSPTKTTATEQSNASVAPNIGYRAFESSSAKNPSAEKAAVTSQVNALMKQGDTQGALKLALNSGYRVFAGMYASADIETWDHAGLKGVPKDGGPAVGPDASDFREFNNFDANVDGGYLTGVNKVELQRAFGMRPVSEEERKMLPDTSGFDDYMVKEVLVEMPNFGFTNRGGPTNKWSEYGSANVQAIRARQNNARAAATAPLVAPTPKK